MSKKRGTILKIKDNLAIIMTSDCKIISIKKQSGMYVGLEIIFNKNEIIDKRRNIVFASRIVAGFVAMFMMLFVFFNLFNNNAVYAYVTLDSNTSIEFELDKNNKVRKVNYFDDDTNNLLKELDLKNKPIDVAIMQVIKKNNLNNSTVLISACLKEGVNKKFTMLVKDKSEEFNKLIDICKNAIESSTSEDIQSKVIEVSYDYKKKADTNKISLGRSIVYEKAKEQKVDFDIEDIKTKSIGETLKKVKIDDVGVIHHVKKDKAKKPASKGKDSPKDKLSPKDKKDPKEEIKVNDDKKKPKGDIEEVKVNGGKKNSKGDIEEAKVNGGKKNSKGDIEEVKVNDDKKKPKDDIEEVDGGKKNPKDDIEEVNDGKKKPKDDIEEVNDDKKNPKDDIEEVDGGKKNPKDDIEEVNDGKKNR